MPARARLLAAVLAAMIAAELGAEVLRLPDAVFVTKATLLPLLAATYLAAVPAPRTAVDRAMTVGFLASWCGDLSLMLAPTAPDDVAVLGIAKHEGWFFAGVGSFLVAHLAFISAFRAVDRPDVPGPFPRRAVAFLPLFAYLVAIAGFLVPRLLADAERRVAVLPVALYGGVLVAMVMAAAQRHGRVSPASAWPTLVGAVVFLLSDSLIALAHLARVPIPEASLAIMVTYLAAEILIGWGIAVQRRGSA